MKDEIPLCQITHQHETELKTQPQPPEEQLYALADLYKVFGDSTRIKILYALFAQELCVCAIAAQTEMSMSAISHQLRVLKQAKLVRFRKEGRSALYTLADAHVKSILAQGMEHICE